MSAFFVFCGEHDSGPAKSAETQERERQALIEQLADAVLEMAQYAPTSDGFTAADARARRIEDQLGALGYTEARGLARELLGRQYEAARRDRRDLLAVISDRCPAKVPAVGTRYPSSASHKQIVALQEISEKLAMLDDLAEVEATTLLLLKTKEGDPLYATLTQRRAGAERRLKDGPYAALVAELAAQIAKETAPVVPTAKAALELFRAKDAGAPADRLGALRRAYADGLQRRMAELKRLDAWKAAQLAARARWEAGHRVPVSPSLKIAR